MKPSFSIKSAYLYGFTAFRDNCFLWVCIVIGIVILQMILHFLGKYFHGFYLPVNLLYTTYFYPIFQIFNWIVTSSMYFLLAKFSLMIMDSKSINYQSIKEIKNHYPVFLLSSLIIMISYFPARIWSHIFMSKGILAAGILYVFVFALNINLFSLPFIILEEKPSVFEALKKSIYLTDGVRLKLLLFFISIFVLNLLGLSIAFLGFVATFPISQMAVCKIYRDLRASGTVTTNHPKV